VSTDADGAGAGGAGGSGLPASSGIDANEYERIRAERDQYAGVLKTLEPYSEDISRFVQDNEYREAVGQYRKVYDDLKQRQPDNGLSPELKTVRDEILGELKPFKEAFESNVRAQQNAENQRKTAVFEEGKPIVLAHFERHPELRQSKAFGRALDQLQAEAIERNVPFKEVWDPFVSAFGDSPVRRDAPPRQLRSNAAEPGIPAANRQPAADPSKPKSVKEAFMETFKRVNGRAS
jgi:hypothetical protein